MCFIAFKISLDIHSYSKKRKKINDNNEQQLQATKPIVHALWPMHIVWFILLCIQSSLCDRSIAHLKLSYSIPRMCNSINSERERDIPAGCWQAMQSSKLVNKQIYAQRINIFHAKIHSFSYALSIRYGMWSVSPSLCLSVYVSRTEMSRGRKDYLNNQRLYRTSSTAQQ